jgi:hypothetical protein
MKEAAAEGSQLNNNFDANWRMKVFSVRRRSQPSQRK